MDAVNLILLGAPGSGKGTLAKMICAEYGLPHLSTGDMLRKSVKDGTELGERVKHYMNEGKLVPDDIVIDVLRQRLSEKDCECGLVMDGFPRTGKQAEELGKILDEYKMSLDAVIYLEVPEEVLISRLTGRRQCVSCGDIYHVDNMPSKRDGMCDICGGRLYQRDDDKRETIEVRLNAYEEKTAGLIDFYADKNFLKFIKGDSGPETVFEEVKSIIAE